MKAVAKISVFCVLFYIFAASGPCKADKVRSPVILVPGDGGSQFEARLNKTKVVHVWCDKTSDWFPLWLNLEELAPYVLDCTVDNLRLVYDNKTRTTSNSPGVEIRQPGFGLTDAVEWLDASKFGPTGYFNAIADILVAAGYVRNVSIRGAPYDFRKAPNENKEFLANLKKLVEDTYELNGQKKVVLLGHSMGNTYVLYLLQKQAQSWKDKYIQSFISLAGPWGGAVKTLRLMASGDNLGVFVVNPLSARPEQRSMPSTAWLMPYDGFWNDTETLVVGPDRNYTVADYKQFFTDIDYMTGYDMRQDVQSYGLGKKLDAPGVEVHCLHGIKVDTPEKFTYTKKSWHDSQPDALMGPGDGTVNIRSLHGCLRWVGKNKGKQVIHKEFDKAEHMGILKDKDVQAYITGVLTSAEN